MSSEQLKLLLQTLDHFSNANFVAYGSNHTDDFREETLPRGTMELKDKSKTAFVAAASEMRLKVYKDHKFTMNEYVEQPGSIMAFMHESATTVWGGTYESDFVGYTTFRTDEDGKLKIASQKWFVHSPDIKKLDDDTKANGVAVSWLENGA